tara:strand:- start:6619 stop:7323 length:705 start_codon:yes stop_codon:yes gene_type:complete
MNALRKYESRLTCGGFTLIELLSVVAIMGVLMGILIPVVGRIRQSAAATECGNNLRQMQIANIAYSQEHDGGYVPVEDLRGDEYTDTPGTGGKWFANKVFYSYLTGENLNRGSWPDEYFCPGSADYGNTSVARSYGYNVTGLNNGETELRQFRRNQIDYPSKMIAFADGLDWKIQASGADLYSEDVSQTDKLSFAVAYRHGGEMNAVFFDGHVERLSKDEVSGDDNLEYWESSP